ncbi:MAG: ArnT family glycosyltransferase [bacterium]
MVESKLSPIPILITAMVAVVLLSSFGITQVRKTLVVPDGFGNAARATAKINSESFFLPVRKKGGELHVNLLALSYYPKYLYLHWTGGKNIARPSEYYLIGRLLSMVCGLLGLYGVFRLSGTIFSRTSAALASLMLSVSFGYVFHARAATEDILLTCFVVLSLYCLTRYKQSDNPLDVALTGVFTGLATSAKASGLLLLIPVGWLLLQSSFHPGSEDDALIAKQIDAVELLRRGSLILGATSVAYLVTTPDILVYPLESLRHFIQEAISRWKSRGFSAEYSGPLLAQYYLARSMGLPLYLLSLVSLGYLIVTDKGRNQLGKLLPVFLFLVPYFAMVSSWNNFGAWAVLPTLPLLLIVTGHCTMSWLKRENVRAIGKVCLVGVIVFTAGYTLVGMNTLRKDSRLRATKWIQRKIPPGSTVDAYSWSLYLPEFPDSITVRAVNLNNGPTRVWPVIPERIRKTQPDFIILSSAQYDRYFNDPDRYPQVTRTFRALIHGKTPYKVVKVFGPGVDLRQELLEGIKETIQPKSFHPVNPTIVILAQPGFTARQALATGPPELKEELTQIVPRRNRRPSG